MAFGVPSFIGLHYKVFDLCQPFLALLVPFFLSWRSLTGIEMRGETLRDFSISSERKLERRGERDSSIGQNLIYFRSFLTFFFFCSKQSGSFNISTPRLWCYGSGLH